MGTVIKGPWSDQQRGKALYYHLHYLTDQMKRMTKNRQLVAKHMEMEALYETKV